MFPTVLSRPLASHVPTPEELKALFANPDQLLTHIPEPAIRHLVPADIIPLVRPPYVASDFFVDLHEHSERVQSQAEAIMQKFPPPLPPMVPVQHRFHDGGIIVPFIYPPVPVLRPDAYLADPKLRKRTRRAPTRRGSTDLTPAAAEDDAIYPTIPPLPFPPPNYMPYPLISDQAPMAPPDVFDDWLDALQHLPRIDMVVASAAGSIYDLRAAADASGLTIAKLDEWMRTHRLESDPEAGRSDSDSELDGYEDYADYADQVDTLETFAPNLASSTYKPPQVVVGSALAAEYVQVAPRVSSKGLTFNRKRHTYEYADRDIEQEEELERPEHLLQNPAKDISNAVGAQKERRRQELVRSYAQLEEFAHTNRAKLYASRKRELLAKLRQLQRSKVFFDDNRTFAAEEEFLLYLAKRQAERDDELVRLKLHRNYEQLNAALAFYQTSNRTYKALTAQVVSKLQKLQHFLTYQKQMLATISQSTRADDILSIRSKESAKLYGSFAERDYSSEIKEVFRLAITNEDRGLPFDHNSTFDAKSFHRFSANEHVATVNDLMPLVTDAEFLLITGEAPTKNGPKDPKGKTAKHHIFQSPLYDLATSGSDTNPASDSTVPAVKRRPGRRAAPKPVYGDEPSKEHSEAALVAKIMKQFVGPAAANADELTNDLDLMGVDTKWPVR